MNNFDFYNPVKILFGEGKINQLASEIPQNSVILVTYGGGSIKSNGVYEQVMSSLSSFKVFEFGGIEPNPRYETLMKAVDIIKANNVNFLLAVGGGSVLDGTKFIAAAAKFKGEAWDILRKGAKIEEGLPLGTILTLPATGSEMNSGGVITIGTTKEKLVFGSSHLFPKFSILDPTVTYSLPKNQLANGIVDAFVHTTEQYLTYPSNSPIQDRYAESILKTLIEIAPQVLNSPDDYQARANFMWSCTMALNGLIGAGVPTDWATHMIGHELTAFFGLDHGVTLAIVLPSLLREMKDDKREKLLQYGKNVWGIETGTEDNRIDEAIIRTVSFFNSLGVKTKLSAHGINGSQLAPIFERFQARQWKLGERKNITPNRIEIILKSAL
ncbi:MAG TPA: NADH-dependent alcohol dehydrogenase [Bacteroidales bacterium]|nr:NADH-dependent alcohol dehydrogenase [Bacteroidales bacterium]